MRQDKIKNKGFTLLELLIVVAIIGLLITIALPAVQEILREGRIRTMQASLEGLPVIATTVEMIHPYLDHALCTLGSPRSIEDIADIRTVLNRNATGHLCRDHPTMARICLQATHVIAVDGSVTTLCGDSEGNMYLGGICSATIPFQGVCMPGAIIIV